MPDEFSKREDGFILKQKQMGTDGMMMALDGILNSKAAQP